MFKRLIIASLLSIGATVSHAQDGNFIRKDVAVSYTDLDLTTPAGQAMLKRRLEIAVRTVCPYPNENWLDEIHEAASCRSRARKDSDRAAVRVVQEAQRRRAGQANLLAGR